MPCSDCGSLLCVSKTDSKSLFCPDCNGYRVESQPVLDAKINWFLKDHVTPRSINHLLTQYSKQSLTYKLLHRVNYISNQFFSGAETPLPLDEFGYIAYLIKRVYEIENSEFGNETLSQDSPDLDETLTTVQEYYTKLVSRLERVQNQFTVCVRDPEEFTGRMQNFLTDYDRYQSEYGLCNDRCTNSVGGIKDEYEDFSYVYDEIRQTDGVETGTAETPREFAGAWYPVIQQLRFIAGSDTRIGTTYKTRFPEGVTVFDIRAFLNELDDRISLEHMAHVQHNSAVMPFRPEVVDECGHEVFGAQWPEVKDYVVMSDNNLDAHPFLFEMTFDLPYQTPQGGSVTVPTTNVYYPRYYAQLLKFQVFPLLQNNTGESNGHTLLSNVAGDNGTIRERNLYEFLTEQDIKCYHSAEITTKNPNEIDLLCVFEDRILFIEVKYRFPPLQINEADGVAELNQYFNRVIFNEVPPDSDRKGKGPFPEKVASWRELDSGDTFTSQASRDDMNREDQTIPDRWHDRDVDMFVVSNVVPSFITKQDVRFLTDIEFYQYIKNDDDSVLYSVSEN
ncbi:hypothetical protein [Haloarchaeobius sp. FL176]|uniref:hypothetical protein n=1 Tax=Haloarchaeobius sp. FL176 TaxID=2967129 RepID=UPI0021494A52|nr:hypothetical protein [Haloarchaeobius sp. FL176]